MSKDDGLGTKGTEATATTASERPEVNTNAPPGAEVAAEPRRPTAALAALGNPPAATYSAAVQAKAAAASNGREA